MKASYNCERRTKSPQTPTPETLQPAPEIRNRRGLFMVAFPFAGQGTRPAVRREGKGRQKVGCQDSNREPCIPGLGCSGGRFYVPPRAREGGGRLAPPALVPPAWGAPAWRGWAPSGALWCFPHWIRPHAASDSQLRSAIGRCQRPPDVPGSRSQPLSLGLGRRAGPAAGLTVGIK